jgi:carboxyl-terminal processing protease
MKQLGTRLTILAAVVVLGMSTTFKADNKYFEISKNLEIFSNLYKELNKYYVDELDPGELMRTGIDAMVGSLDPFTNYISESDIEGYRYMTEGRYNGIGAMSEMIDDYVTITELYEGQPAAEAGLKVGDQIVAVEGKAAKGKTPDEVNEILRGFPGTEVELTLKRPGQSGTINIRLVRGEVSIPNVLYKGLVSEDVGYIALTTFTRDAGRNVGKALKELQVEQPNLKGVILDLRGNGGGLLTEAVNVSNVFVPKNELVVTTKGKVKEWDRSFKTLNTPIDTEIPLVVLIDRNSASASEIVSGVIQDYDRGVLIGQRTYGKGLVQNTRDVGYNAKVKLTTAKYYIPSGRCIQSVKYEDGEPVHIPDDQRQPFKTRNGRTVLDGGGVKPDIVMEEITDNRVVKSLIEEHYLFDYVTQFCLDRESIPEVQEFSFDDYAGFRAFLQDRSFEYTTESEKLLEKLEKVNREEGYALEDELEDIERGLEEAKRAAIVENEEAIRELIEEDIATRYYYQVGKIKMRLKNDAEIAKAIELLNDPESYAAVLK